MVPCPRRPAAAPRAAYRGAGVRGVRGACAQPAQPFWSAAEDPWDKPEAGPRPGADCVPGAAGSSLAGRRAGQLLLAGLRPGGCPGDGEDKTSCQLAPLRRASPSRFSAVLRRASPSENARLL